MNISSFAHLPFAHLIVVALCSISPVMPTLAVHGVETFSRLPIGDTLQVRFSSQGCFHHRTYDLTFHRERTVNVTVVEVKQEWSDTDFTYIDKHRLLLGEVQLTESNLMGLDSLLKFYRSGPGDGCTTVDSITISQVRGGRIIAAEGFKDGSCDTHHMEGITTLADIGWRLQKR